MAFSHSWKRIISFLFVVSVVHGSIVTIGSPPTPASSGLSKGRRVFLLEGSPHPSLIVQLGIYFRNMNPFYLQIWRPKVEEEFKFRLTEEFKIYPERIGVNEISASSLPCLLLNTNDRLGLYIEDQPSSVVFVYDFEHPAVLSYTYEDDGSSSVALGDTLVFDSLPMALVFSINAELYIGEENSPGNHVIPTCDDLANFTKSTTTVKPIGPTNPTVKGEKGDRGAPGPLGPPGPIAPTADASLAEDESSLVMKPSVIVALLIWNMILTVISLLFCYLHAHRLQHRVQPDQNQLCPRLSNLK